MKSAIECFKNENFDLSWIKPIIIVDKFVEERTLQAIDNCTSESIWDDFCEFCGGTSPIAKQSFFKLLTNNYPLKSKCVSIENRVCRILVISYWTNTRSVIKFLCKFVLEDFLTCSFLWSNILLRFYAV